jgi:hypothetical protein
VDPLPERVRLVDGPRGLRDVELEVLGWRTEEGETAFVLPAGGRQRGDDPGALDGSAAEGRVGAGGWWAGLAGGVAAAARAG